MIDLSPYRKAIVGFIIPLAASVIAAMTPDSIGGVTIVPNEWIYAIAAAILTSAGVYQVRNTEVE